MNISKLCDFFFFATVVSGYITWLTQPTSGMRKYVSMQQGSVRMETKSWSGIEDPMLSGTKVILRPASGGIGG